MMWRVFIAIGLIVAIIVSGILFVNGTSKLCDRLTSDMVRCLAAPSASAATFAGAYELWSSKRRLLATIIVQNRITTISASFERAKAFLKEETYDEYLAAIGEIVMSLELLRAYDMPSYSSIF
ncbi:MAG: DUF4363 family protein [Angelakisella sp.]